MLVSEKELTNLKLKSVRSDDLKELALSFNINHKGTVGELIKKLINLPPVKIDSFIREKYQSQVKNRQKLISDGELIKEVRKVEEINWGVVQGQLDQKIQSEYVRKFYRYEELITGVKSKLHNEITSYVIASWYNHWTTVLIEDHIGLHQRVIPTLKNNFGIDIFFDEQPSDLKTTYLPRGYSIDEAIKNPQQLAIWMYENQGAQRFGADNRLFVILADKNNLDRSWKLKRNFDFVFEKVDNFFNNATISKKDEIIFTFKNKTYTTISKVLLIVK